MKKIYEAPFVEIKEFSGEDTMTTFVSSITVAKTSPVNVEITDF